MNQTQHKTYSVRWRPFLLTLAMCLSAFFAAWAIGRGSSLFGILFLIVMGGVFAVLSSTASHPAVMAIGASVSVVLLQLFGDFFASLMGVTVLIAALVLSYQVRSRTPKTTVLVTVSLILGGGFLLTAALLYAIDGGSLAPSDLLEKYGEFFKQTEIEYAKILHEKNANLDEMTLSLYANMDITREMLLEMDLDNLALAMDIMQLILPGVLVLFVQLLAYAEIAAFRIAARFAHVEALLPAPRWTLIPTQVSCIVYIAVAIIYVIGSFISEPTSAFMTVMANLWLVLLPTMLFCGVRVLTVRLRHPLYRMGTGLIVMIFVFGFFFIPYIAAPVALFMLSFLGAQTISTMHTVEAEKNKQQ